MNLGLPNIPYAAIVGAAFWNANYASCYVYNGRPGSGAYEHRLVQDVLWNTNFSTIAGGLSGGQWAATCATDPDVSQSVNINSTIYDNSLSSAVSGGKYFGPFQQYYGWLGCAIPGNVNPYPACWKGQGYPGQNLVLMHQYESFWRRF